MFPLLALASAILYGAADFIGGLASRRADTMVVVLVSQAAGLLMIALALPFLAAASPSANDWIWGGVAGLAGGGGVALLYRALAVGRMAVVAPVTAVCAVIVPVAVAILLGERPGLQASSGIVLAVVAIVLVSRQGQSGDASSAESRAGLGLAFASGIVIGLFFLALARTSASAGVWPLIAARIVSVALMALLIFSSSRSLMMTPSVRRLSIGGGIVDMLANLLYLFASRLGPLTLVVTLTSLYPASTVLLARVVLAEQITAHQWIGVVCALAAILIIVSA
jgi:drug/metabolite transporter (DMT)-like permease